MSDITRKKTLLKDKGLQNFCIINSRIRVLRNIKNFKFAQHLDKKQKIEIENIVINLFVNSQFKISIIDCNNFSSYEKNFYKEKFFINENSLGKNKRIIYFNELDIIIIFNEIDHIRVIGVSEGLKLKFIFKEVFNIEEFLSDFLKFSASIKYGYLTPVIKNCGLGLKLSSLILLPGISLNENKESIFSDLEYRGYFIVPLYENSFYYIVSSNINFGVSEEKLVERFEQGINSLLEIDKKELMQFYNKNKENIVDIVFRSYGLLKYAQRLSYEEALENLSNVLIGVMVNILYFKKKINIARFFDNIKESNIIRSNEDCNDVDRIRGDIIRNFINSIGENNV